MINPSGNAPSSTGSGYTGGDWISAAMQIGASIYNSAQDRKQSKENTKRTISANKEMAEYQYEKNLEMWKLQNLYNSPEQQMARLRAAGLNPNLVYGDGAVGNQSGPPPKYERPEISYMGERAMKIPAMISMFQDLEMKQAQIENVRAGTRNIDERTVNEKIAQVLGLVKSRVAKGTEEYQVEASRLGNVRTRKLIAQEIEKIKLLSKDQQIRYFDTLIRKQQARGAASEADKKAEELDYMKWKNKLRDYNLTDTDNVILRQIIRLFSDPKFKEYGKRLF